MTDAAGEPRKGGLRRWAPTLLALALIAAIATIAIPRTPSPSQASPEWVAVAGLRSIATAQKFVRERSGKYRTADVRALHYELGLVAREIADADAAPRDASRPRVPDVGYWYAAVKADDGFCVCAYPNAYPHVGRHTFFVGEDGIVWMKDQGGAPIAARPRDPASEGWRRAP